MLVQALVVGTLPIDGIVRLRDTEMAGFAVARQHRTAVKMIDGDNLEFAYDVAFRNDTSRQVKKVVVRVRSWERGKVAYKSPQITFTKFNNFTFPHSGSILPYSSTISDSKLTVKVPSMRWNMGSRFEVIVDEVWIWDGKGSLTNPDNLLTTCLVSTNDQLIQLFRKNPALVKVKNSQGFSPVLMAFASSNVDVIKGVMKLGANPKHKTTKGHDAMFMAAISAKPENLEFALSLGCPVNQKLPNSGRTPLLKAVAESRIQSVKWLLAKGAKVDDADKAGQRPMHYAIERGLTEIIRELARNKANLRYRDGKGWGYLHFCVTNYSMYPLIRSLGIPIDDRGPNGFTPLMAAAQSGLGNGIQYLVRHGANLNLKDATGKTARDYASEANTRGSDEFFMAQVAEGKRLRG